MKFTVLGFNQLKAIEYKLDISDLLILRWFVDFNGTGKMAKHIIDNETFYWIKYDAIIKDIPIINMKKDTIYRRLIKLADAEILKHTTLKKDGTYSLYTFGKNYELMLSDINPSGTDENPNGYGYKSVGGTDINPDQKINLLNNQSTINIYSEIIDFLNEQAGTNYKSNTPKTKELINARLKEGFVLEDFKQAIENKCSQWLHDEKMYQFLRPSTLFGTKFEAYVNEKKKEVDTRFADCTIM